MAPEQTSADRLREANAEPGPAKVLADYFDDMADLLSEHPDGHEAHRQLSKPFVEELRRDARRLRNVHNQS